jgi:hypothetical protein
MQREHKVWAGIMNALFVGVLGFLIGVCVTTNLTTNQKRELDATHLLVDDESNLVATLKARTADLYQRAARAESKPPILVFPQNQVASQQGPVIRLDRRLIPATVGDKVQTRAESKPDQTRPPKVLLTAAGWNEYQAKISEDMEDAERDIQTSKAEAERDVKLSAEEAQREKEAAEREAREAFEKGQQAIAQTQRWRDQDHHQLEQVEKLKKLKILNPN